MDSKYVITLPDSNYDYHNDNSVRFYIRNTLTVALDNNHVGFWQVAQSNQPTIQALQNNTVYFDVISKRRYGVQANRELFDTTSQSWYTATQWLEEWIVQVSAFQLRNTSDDPNVMIGIDILTQIQSFINGGGLALTAPQGSTIFDPEWLDVLWSKDLREIDFETDSGLKEKLPQFDFGLVVSQTLLNKIPQIDNINITTERI